MSKCPDLQCIFRFKKKEHKNAQKTEKCAKKGSKNKEKNEVFLRYLGNKNSYYKSAGDKTTRFSVQFHNDIF